ncbi:DNA cytosine methyltransferase [Iodobacter sp. CM08]|nr:DNA cytosine methyltransferase [Iodobacter sp. CM08]
MNAINSVNPLLKSYAIRAVTIHRKAPRIYLYGADTQRAGFKVGDSYSIEKQASNKCLILKRDPSGDRVVTLKKRGNKELGVIDLNSHKVIGMFEGLSSVRVLTTKDAIYIQPTDVELRKNERNLQLKTELENGVVTTASISHGAGILDYAIHEGLEQGGVIAKLMAANEIRDELLDNASEFNPIWNEDTVYLASPMQELAFDRHVSNMIKPVSILCAGIPCSAASTAGRSAKGTAFAEQHDQVGHLIVPFLSLLARFNCAILVFENVTQYSNTASMAILRTTLKEWGYNLHETVIDSSEFNSFEKRRRLCLVAVSEGIEFDFNWLIKPEHKEQRLGDLLEVVPQGDPRWRDYAAMKEKEVRDIEKGNGFKMQIYNEDSPSVNVLTKGIAKIRSTDPKIASPYGDGLIREFTPREHALFKGVLYDLVSDMCNTNQHEALGQSICTAGFVAVARDCIAEALRRFAAGSVAKLLKPSTEAVTERPLAPVVKLKQFAEEAVTAALNYEGQLSLFA